MRTEFQKPTLMPLQSSPVQAEDQAVIQGWSVGAAGQAKMLPSRISSMGLSEVTTMIQSGSRKNSGGGDEEGVDADAAGREARGRRPCGPSRRRCARQGRDHARPRCGRM